MTNKEVWLVTDAGRGLGIDIAQKALAAGHAVVATGRKADRVLQAIGTHDNLLTVSQGTAQFLIRCLCNDFLKR